VSIPTEKMILPTLSKLFRHCRNDWTSLPRTSAEIAAAYPRSKLKPGDLLLGIRASIGAAHIVPPHYRRHELENHLRPLFAAVVDEHAETALSAAQAYVDGVLSQLSIEQRQR
jgi:hypothetical protein